MIKDIKASIITNLEAVSTLNHVYAFEKLNPAGFPAAFVTFQGTENEFYTNAENKRVFVYAIRVLAQIGQDRSATDRVEKAEEVIQDVTGDILDSLDSDIELGDNAEVVFMEAALGEPEYVEYEGGWARSVVITARVHSIYLV